MNNITAKGNVMAGTSKQDFNQATADKAPEASSAMTMKTIHDLAEKAYQAFPDRLENLVIVSYPHVIYTSPQITKQLPKGMDEIQSFSEDATSNMFGANAETWPNVAIANNLANVIAFPEGSFERSPDNTFYTTLHELGHVAVKSGMVSDRNLSESSADAFATLVYIQQFGKNALLALSKLEDRAIAIIRSMPDSYSSNAIEQAMDFADKMGQDFFKLSWRELAEHAAEIAKTTELSVPVLEKIRNAYEPARYETDNPDFPQKIIEVMNDNKQDPDIFLAGKRALGYPSLKKILIEQAATKHDAFWQDALKLVDGAIAKKPAAPTPRLA
jgi:hypothetical protein